LDEKDKHTHITTLQSLQRDINFLKKSSVNNPSLERIIDTLRNSQTQLYEALAQHGVTAQAVHQIIQENSDKQLIAEIMKLQGMKDKITQQLADPSLTPQKRQSLERSFSRAKQAHADRWQEIINSPRRAELLRMIEQAQIKQLRKQQSRDRSRTHDRTR
jgi:hypothetical protein